MFEKRKLSFTILFAVLLTALFYKQGLGINLVIAELVLVGYLLLSKQIQLKNYQSISVFGLMLISLVFTIFTHSIFIYIMHFILLGAFVGLLIYPNAKSVSTYFSLAIANVTTSQFALIESIGRSKIQGRNVGRFLWRIKLYFIPVLIIFIFLLLYSNSNPVFYNVYKNIQSFVFDKLNYLLQYVELSALITFFVGLLLSAFLIYRSRHEEIIKSDDESIDFIKRNWKKPITQIKTSALRQEYKAAVFLVFSLNILLLTLNFLDIQNVWFNFIWEGQYLKEFVHQGTYLLIISIVISILIVLYFFRSNLNFYSKNKLLKILSYIWITQNALLVISVALRNFYYIQHFALAYKRIGVFIFLLIVLFGLFTVYMKVKNGKSTFYIIRTNLLAWLYIISFSALFNWDVIIAKYNFQHANRSFLHLEFLANLSDKALPYLDYPIQDLLRVEEVQYSIFSFKKQHMSPIVYKHIIKARKRKFMLTQKHKSWLSWNWPEYKAERLIQTFEQ